MGKVRRGCGALVSLAVIGGFTFAAWLNRGIQPLPKGAPVRIEFRTAQSRTVALQTLERRGILKNAAAADLYASLLRLAPARVTDGTYRLNPGMTVEEALKALRTPLRNMVRLPETNWARRSASLLERAKVCTAEEYMALVNNPARFAGKVSFPLPSRSLEGYLYPDTYDLPEGFGAERTILRQLKTFEKRVWEGLGKPRNLHRLVIIGSMVQLEVMHEEEKPKVAGVIENRLQKRMRLQIDATINYGLQVWRPLTFADYRNVDSPYNTYRVDGLPPGPICSPTVSSVRAAMNPDRHGDLYYVAMPDGYHLFSANYDEHRRNIAKRRSAIAAETRAAQARAPQSASGRGQASR